MAEPRPTPVHTAPPAWRRSLPTWAHAASLVVGFVVLLVLSRDQWFFLDEWDILWQAEADRRAVEGHNGHWSLVPIAVWRLLQSVFGLSSYQPYMIVAILTHLTVAHLLWRVMRRVGVASWIGVALAAVFVLLGAAGENLFWGFQMGFMGAVAFGLGALLVAMRPTMPLRAVIGCAVLLLLGAATAGTALPLFIPVALTLLTRHGWRAMLAAVAPPALAYLSWFFFFEASNPTEIFRAGGPHALLEEVPVYMATMFVGGFDTLTPVPGFGIVVTTALVVGVIVAVGRRPLRPDTITVLGLLAAAVFFAALTAYSRVGLGVATATDSRYVYVVVVTTLPAVGLLLTRLARRSVTRELVVLALIAVVGVYNVGLLIGAAGAGAETEQRVHRIISAALDIADAHPEAVDADSRPAGPTAQRTLAQLQQLEEQYALTRIPYTESDRLEALADVSLSATPIAGAVACEEPLVAGTTFPLTADGQVVESADGGQLSVQLTDDGGVAARTLPLAAGANELTIAAPVTVVVSEVSGAASLCR